MARHRLSLEEQRTGVIAAIRSKVTPERLRPALRRRLEVLEREIARHGGRRSSGRNARPMFLGWFQF
jgi:hypothetical protein